MLSFSPLLALNVSRSESISWHVLWVFSSSCLEVSYCMAVTLSCFKMARKTSIRLAFSLCSYYKIRESSCLSTTLLAVVNVTNECWMLEVHFWCSLSRQTAERQIRQRFVVLHTPIRPYTHAHARMCAAQYADAYVWSYRSTHTHTDTHTYTQRERERERETI